MRDDHHGPPGQVRQQPQHHGGVGGVEAAGGLVREDHLWIVDECPGDREALLLASGKLMGPVVGHVAQTELVDQFGGAPGAAARSTREPRWHQYVLSPGELLDQLKLLEHEADVAQPDPRERAAAAACKPLTADRDAAAVGRVETAEHVQQRRLTRTGAADYRHHLVGFDRQADVIEHGACGAALADALDQTLGLQHGHQLTVPCRDGQKMNALPSLSKLSA